MEKNLHNNYTAEYNTQQKLQKVKASKTIYPAFKIASVFILILATSTFCISQSYYRSNGNVSTDASTNWLSSNDSSSWIPASFAPSGSESITMVANDTLTVNSLFNISGSLHLSGNVTQAVRTIGGSLFFLNNSVCELNNSTITKLPIADNWDVNSTILITKIATGTNTLFITNNHYGNVIHNYTTQTADVYYTTSNLSNIFIDGNFIVQSTNGNKLIIANGNTGADINFYVGKDFKITGLLSIAKVQFTALPNYNSFNIYIGGTLEVSNGNILSNLAADITKNTFNFTNSGVINTDYDFAYFTVKITNAASYKLNGNFTLSSANPYAVMVVDGILDFNGYTFAAANNSAASFTLSNAATIKITSPLGLNGCFAAGSFSKSLNSNANYIFTATVPQVTGTFNTSPTINTIKNLVINATSTVELSNAINITGTLNVITGQLMLGNNNITLKSTDSSNANVANAGVAVPFTYGTGKFIIETYIPGGKRAYRFLGHPFTNTLNLTELTDDILITGGTGTGGFTATGTNNASAFWYDTFTGTEDALSDIGWKPFTTTDGSGISNTWQSQKGIRVMVRGNISDGLNPAMPSPVTIDLAGELNIGTQTINLNSGANSGYNFIANPFASGINLRETPGSIERSNTLAINNNFYVWDLNLGTKGGWSNNSMTSNYYLAACSGFFVHTTSSGNNFKIYESAKTTSIATNQLFKGKEEDKDMVRLLVKTDNTIWDKIDLYFNNKSSNKYDMMDGKKIMNSEVNAYTITNDGQKNSIDTRPYDDQNIPLGIITTIKRNFSFYIEKNGMKDNVSLFLHDKFLNNTIKIEKEVSYDFAVTNDPLSYGNERFEIVKKINVITPFVETQKPSIILSPNPAIDNVLITFNNSKKGKSYITITDTKGNLVKSVDASAVKNNHIKISLKNLLRGIYYITLNSEFGTSSEKLIIQ